jgi:hypothetical protein
MAESEEEEKTPTKAVTDTQNEVAGELASVLNKRFEQVSDQNKKEKGLGKFFSFGDSTKTILSSVEKSMFLQTSFLESINRTLINSNLIAAETREDAERQANLDSVSEDDPAPSSEPKSIFAAMSDKFKEGKDDFKKKASDALLGAEDDGFLKRAGKVLATAYLGGKAVSGFVGNLADKAFNKLGFGEEKSKAMGETTGDAAGLGTGASVIAMSLKKFGLKGPGGLQAFATAAVSKITYDALGSLDIDGDGKILGVQKELVQGVGAGLAGVGTFIATGKGFKAVGQSLSKAFGAVKAKLGINTKIPTPKAPGAPTGKVPKAPKLPTPKAPPTPKIPSALNVNTSGIANQGRPSTVKAVAERLKSINPAKLSKFSKFFKFAGPAAAIIPALIDPALAIMNDAPDDVVKKEIAGALGSIGGASLGLLAGGALGTAIPIPFIGSGIGGFIGGIAGAFGGEYIAEKIAGFFMGGPQVGKEEKKELEDSQKGGIGKKGRRGGSKKKPSEMAGAKIGDVDMGPTSEQKVADAQVNADATGKALADFESTAKSGRTVTEEDNFGFQTTKTVFDDAEEQAQFDKLNAAKFDAENELFDAKNEMITGDEFDTAGMFDKLMFLQNKGLLPKGESKIEMGKFVDGPLKGKTPDEVINEYVKANSTVKPAAESTAPVESISSRKKKPRSIMQEAGIQSAPEKLMAKSKAISDEKASQDGQSKAVMMQNLNKGGDTITNTNKGGDSTTVNVLKGGSNSLANAHIPVPQAI